MWTAAARRGASIRLASQRTDVGATETQVATLSQRWRSDSSKDTATALLLCCSSLMFQGSRIALVSIQVNQNRTVKVACPSVGSDRIRAVPRQLRTPWLIAKSTENQM